jgi:hypothetical protein
MADWIRSLFPTPRTIEPSVPETILLENLQMTHDAITMAVPAKVDNFIDQLVKRLIARHRHYLHRHMDIRQKVIELNLIECCNDLGKSLGNRLRFKIDETVTPSRVVAYYHGRVDWFERRSGRMDGTRKIVIDPLPAEPTPIEAATMKELTQPDVVKRWTEACLAIFSKAISNGLKVTIAVDKPCTLIFDFSSPRTTTPPSSSAAFVPTPGEPWCKINEAV